MRQTVPVRQRVGRAVVAGGDTDRGPQSRSVEDRVVDRVEGDLG